MAHKIERAVLAQRIRELDGLTNDERSALLELLNTKKFGLVWENKPEDVEERLRESLPVLKEVKEKALTQGGTDAPNHIIIEGDNLEALAALTYTHEGKIDVIYIDPPYNTGKEDFVYNDNYVDFDDSYRHSKWLSFIRRRLKIAHRLLKPNGLIWISIDENELFNLKIACDELFLEQNFRSLITIISNPGGRDYGGIAKTTDYLLVYAKTEESVISKIPDENHIFDMKDELGPFELRELRNRNTKFNDNNRPNLCYPFYVNPNDIDEFNLYSISLERDEFHCIEVYPLKSQGIQTVWRWGKEERSRKNLNINIKAKKKQDGTFMIVEKYRDENVMMKNFLSEKKYRTEQGSLQIKDILGEKKFDYPKPVEIPYLVIQTFNDKSATILDFFAGSGTTLHATMQLNDDDKGHRQCILVTNNENNICEEVTYERNKRVINGYTTSKGVAVEGLHGNNLRYYKVGFVPRENTLSAKRQLMAASTDLLCIKNGIYTEQSQFGTLALKPNIARYFEENGKRMLVIFREEAIEKLVAEIKRMTLDEPIITYVFSSNNYAMDADFEEVEDKVSLCALPAAIYNAYLKVLPKRKAKNPENEDAGESGESMEEQQKLDFGEEETL